MKLTGIKIVSLKKKKNKRTNFLQTTKMLGRKYVYKKIAIQLNLTLHL